MTLTLLGFIQQAKLLCTISMTSYLLLFDFFLVTKKLTTNIAFSRIIKVIDMGR